MKTQTYYEQELDKVNVGQTEFAPTIKIFANGNGENTKHLSLNEESARILIHWLSKNFFHVSNPPKK
jgi:hypothetical protein